jgi:hypothetical protein
VTPGPPSAEAAEELDALRAALAGEVDEEVVSAQWFRPPGWGSALKGLVRGLGRLVPGPKEPQRQLRAMNVMALTPTRVVAYRLRTGAGGMSAGRKVAEWPVAEVSIGAKQHEVSGTKTDMSPAHGPSHWSADMTLVALRGRGGQPLLLEGDFPRSALTRHLVESVREAAGA